MSEKELGSSCRSLFILIACAAQEASKQHFIEGSLKRTELEALVTKKKTFSLPQFRVYDRQGRQVADFGSGFDDTFSGQLNKIFKSPTPTKSETTLHDELVKVIGPDEKPLPDFPEFQFAIVEYWAEWCEPCKAQAGALAPGTRCPQRSGSQCIPCRSLSEKGLGNSFCEKEEEVRMDLRFHSYL